LKRGEQLFYGGDTHESTSMGEVVGRVLGVRKTDAEEKRGQGGIHRVGRPLFENCGTQSDSIIAQVKKRLCSEKKTGDSKRVIIGE